MDLDQLRALVLTTECGTYLEAARRSGTPRTTLRRRVEALEAHFGTTLLERHGQDLVLTPPGRALLPRATALLADADALQRSLSERVHDPTTGVVALLPLGIHPLAVLLAWQPVRHRFPAFHLHVRIRRDPVATLAHEGDFALHWGPSVPDGPWFARRIASVPFRLLASAAYAEEHGVPRTVEEVHDHPLFLCDALGLHGDRLPLRRGGHVAVAPTLTSENVVTCGEAARLGCGLGLAPQVAVPGDGWPDAEKVTVLAEQVGVDLPVWLVTTQAVRQRPSLHPLLAELDGLLDLWTSAT